MRILVKLFFSCLLLALLWLKVDPEKLTDTAMLLSGKAISYCVGLYFLAFLISVYKWQLLLPYIGLGKLLLVSLIGQFYSTVLPGQIAGEVAKAYRLGRGRKDAEHMAASVIVDKLTGLIGLLAVAEVGLAASPSRLPLEISLSISLLTALFLAVLFFIKLSFVHSTISTMLTSTARRWPCAASVVTQLLKLMDAWSYFVTKPLWLIFSFMLGIAFQFMLVWVTLLMAQELDINVPLADWCWIFALVSVAVLIPVGIGGIGIREGTFAGTLSLQGVPIEKSITLSIAVFAVFSLTAAIGGLLELFRGKGA